MILDHLGADWATEFSYITNIILQNPKNYQVWFVGLRLCGGV